MSENIESSNVENKEVLTEEKKEINNYDIEECPDGDNCIVKRAMNSGLLPNDVKDDRDIRGHIAEYHSQLNIFFNEDGIQEAKFLMDIQEAKFLIDIINQKKERINNIEQNKIKCFNCKKSYDDEDRKKFYLSCCCNTLCHQCVEEIKSKECPFCKKSLDYLKDFKLDKKTKIEGEECFLCFSILNNTQYTGKVKLDCKCKLELCITCAYKSLKDSCDNERITILEDGVQVIEKYTIKGKCPQCREIPKNKEEITMLYGFLPPTY